MQQYSDAFNCYSGYVLKPERYVLIAPQLVILIAIRGT